MTSLSRKPSLDLNSATVYVRVSTDEQARKDISLDMQERRCGDAVVLMSSRRHISSGANITLMTSWAEVLP